MEKATVSLLRKKALLLGKQAKLGLQRREAGYVLSLLLLVAWAIQRKECSNAIEFLVDERRLAGMELVAPTVKLADRIVVLNPKEEPVEGADKKPESGSANGDNVDPPTPVENYDSRPATVVYSGSTNTTNPIKLGKHMCIIQPIKSLQHEWALDNVQSHVALKAFLASFVASVDESDNDIKFTIFYGFDVQDPVLGVQELFEAFDKRAREMVGSLDVNFHYRPLFGLEGRLTGIWNELAVTAYHRGCDYFFMSNDDMVILTKGWAQKAIESLTSSKYRRCKYLGIVRFKDDWASWADFTFHVSSRLHMEIFSEIYYNVPYHNSHNDLWIHYVYKHLGSNLNPKIHVRNRVYDFQANLTSDEEARYHYDKKSDFDRWKYRGRDILERWIESAGDRCDLIPGYVDQK